MILLNPIIEVGALADANGFQITSCSVFEPVYCVARQDRFTVGLAAINHDPLGRAVALERLPQKPLGGREIAPLAKPELDRVAMAVNCTVQVHPPPTNFDIRLVEVPLATRKPLPAVELLQQERRVVGCPTMNSGVVNRDAALGHHLLK